MPSLPLVNGVPTDDNLWQTTPVWSEVRELPGNTKATVTAFVVPKSGVGWVDCEWRGGSPHRAFDLNRVQQSQRVLADWAGQDHAAIVRQVVKLADAWFEHCQEQAEREVAVKALAGPSGPPPGDLGGNYPGPFISRTGPNGPSLPSLSPPDVVTQMMELQRKMDEQESALAQGQAMRPWDQLYDASARMLSRPGMDETLPAPDAGNEVVQGLLSGLAGSAIFGAPEGASDGLSDFGDDVP